MADGAGSIPAGLIEENTSEKSPGSSAVSTSFDEPVVSETKLGALIEDENSSGSQVESIDPVTERPHECNNEDDSFNINENESESVLEGENVVDTIVDRLSPMVSTGEVESDSPNQNPDGYSLGEGESLLNHLLTSQKIKGPIESVVPFNDKKLSNALAVINAPHTVGRIFYSGYKKKLNTETVVKPERKIMVRNNPFNPSWKKGSKIVKSADNASKNVDLITSSDLNLSDCTHYLGLQPSINFRCSHCGMSGFESIQLLNLHQVECRKVLGHSTSTNIKITRKVYLCSACGTYYESWHLFYHMRKVHDKFMCLYCLGMFTYSEKLCEHLMNKHQVSFVNFPDLDSFKKCNLSSYLFLCLECDNVMSDTDNFKHTCVHQKAAKSVQKQVQNMPIPCVSPVTVVEPSSNKIVGESSAASKNILTDDFTSDASNFCHIDMQSPNKESPAIQPSQQTQEEVLPKVNSPPPRVSTPPPNDDVSFTEVSSPEISSPLRASPSSNSPSPPPPVKISTVPPKTNSSSKSITAPARSSSFLSEFPKIGLQPPKNLADKNSADKFSDRDGKSSSKGFREDEVDSESYETSRFENKSSPRIKSIKRQRKSSGRQIKRPKLDPEQQKDALDRLTETIDAVAKNYSFNLSPALSPDKDENVEKLNLPHGNGFNNHDFNEKEIKPEKDKEDNYLAQSDAANEDLTLNGVSETTPMWKSVPNKDLAKFKLNTDIESDEESDDSNKLSMVIDETPAHSDNDSKMAKISIKGTENTSDDSNQEKVQTTVESSFPQNEDNAMFKSKQDEIALAGEDVPAMALTLDDKVDEVKVQHILKECVRTSCMSCNYCRRALKIAVNGKYLALHLLSEHRYTPTKNDSPEDVINKLKSSLNELESMYFNTESYDSSDPSINVPYDKDNTFDCFQCNYVTYSHKELHIHKRKSHTKSLLLCIMCKINFYSYSELLCHLCPGHYNAGYQFNNIDMSFRCCFCRLDTIPSAFRLMVHLRKCHHTCDICLEVCSDQQKLSTHMWKHKLNHLCYRCGIAYASKLDITKHLFWKHGTESVLCKKCLQKKWPHVYHFCIPPTSFLCEECNSSFSKAVALKVHKRIHAGDFSYHCTQCEKKFVSKKLLQRHEDYHNNPVDPGELDDKKEEIIDVTGESTGNTDGVVETQVEEGNENQKSSDKENEISKHHKKHKKDKKAKLVIDVYDLPPLNLSSESDSSDDESTKNTPATEGEADQKELESKIDDIPDNVKENIEPPKTSVETSVDTSEETSLKDTPVDSLIPTTSSLNDDTKIEEDKLESPYELKDSDTTKDSMSEETVQEQSVENTSIWENFYKTNSNNKNLPYPLCAMKSEDAYKIIMGDHDYCKIKTTDPVIKEDILQLNLDGDIKVDPSIPTKQTELNETTASDSSPTKKKQKSPKKKSGNNSSSSSDSSSDSDSSSCSCGDNCSCSSSSSDSSSSSSSDSDSSVSEGGSKQKTEKRKKRKDKKSKTKNSTVVDQNGENKTIVESVTPSVPEEPAIRESDLETDESSTDEEFYDRQPQKISNQLLAEKRNQLMLLASVAPVHGEGLGHELTKTSSLNDALSDFPVTAPSTPDSSQQLAKKSSKNRRKKSFMMKSRKRVNKNYSFNNAQQTFDPTHKSPKPFNILKVKEPKRQERPAFIAHTPPLFIRNTQPSENNSGPGSESDNVRSSKRKRIPNKFYGYSSGEEDDRAQQTKWRKPEVVTPPPPPVAIPKFIHSTPHTPKIQLSVPKQIIRKNNSDPSKPGHYLSGTESTDSSSDTDKRFNQSVKPHHPSTPHEPPHPPSTKQDKNLYCYCRCPYDEVSEMIACDDENCKIEWFHFECVGISVPPKGQWYCPQCSKKRGILS